MEYRNRKGQVLIEAILLLFIFGFAFNVFTGLINSHRSEITKYKMSKENHRSFTNENTEIIPAE